jgi:hypothetical protein
MGQRGVVLACGDSDASGASWAKGRVGRKVGRAESKEKEFLNKKIGFLNLSRLWKFVEGDLGGILAWGFFLILLGSSRILEKYNMPFHASYTRFIFGRFLYCKFICILYALICGQNFILVRM